MVLEKFDVEMNVAMSQIVQCNDPLAPSSVLVVIITMQIQAR
jgi:hypothetical protein